jgi:hypothetical protein
LQLLFMVGEVILFLCKGKTWSDSARLANMPLRKNRALSGCGRVLIRDGGDDDDDD